MRFYLECGDSSPLCLVVSAGRVGKSGDKSPHSKTFRKGMAIALGPDAVAKRSLQERIKNEHSHHARRNAFDRGNYFSPRANRRTTSIWDTEANYRGESRK